MKAITKLLLATSLLAITGCQKEDNLDKIQAVWINGYEATTYLSNYELAPITLMFFSEDVKLKFTPKSYPSNAEHLYDYIQIAEDDVYTNLMDKQKLLLDGGDFATPVEIYHTVSNPTSHPQLTAKLPIGTYFIVALYSYRDTRRVYWNKYACTEYQVYERYNPLALTVVIPADITQYGCIPWVNWADKMYDF